MNSIQEILNSDDIGLQKALFTFDKTDSNEAVLLKYNLWSRFFFAKYYTSPDCKAHKEMDMNNIRAYRSEITQYVNIAFRGFSKTARTKLFIAFCIANDTDHTKRFFRCISADLDNAKQSVTDIYNMFVQPRVRQMYPEIFEKTESKREETMAGFTTSTGVKMLAKQIGVDQRGKIMEEAKSDFDWYDDIETKTTIRSALITHKISENMEEARTGLAINGVSIYTCNYFSEAGNVHRLVTKESDGKVVQITPIMTADGEPTWSRYSKEDIERMKRDDEDFEGERMCFKPNTKVWTEKGLVEISRLMVGDLVWTHENRLKPIKTVFQSEAIDLLDITVDGKVTTITKNHPILVMRNNTPSWIPAGELSVSDLLVKVRHGNLNS